jgi:alpha-ketoglutarate-dependent taurine dioxygenase
MTTSCEIETDSIIHCFNMNDLEKQILIYEKIEKDGFVILQAWDNSDDTLKSIANYFGHIQSHPNADEFGIVKVKPKREETIKNVYDRFISMTSSEFYPHTDGSYLDGFALISNKVIRINPPKLWILQCVQPAKEGGISFLVDTQEILQKLWVEEPEHAKVVTQPKSLVFCGGEQYVNHSSLFEKLSRETWRVRFRSDLMYVEPWAYFSVKHVVENYLLNPKFRKFHRLTEGQILITDNYRVLHGRNAITSEKNNQSRLLNKTWIWDASINPLLHLIDSPNSHSFKAFKDYHPLNIDRPSKMQRVIQTGIKL